MSHTLVHEMWRDTEGLTMVCLAGPQGDGARNFLEQGAELVWVFQASSHYQAMTMYYQRMGWGEYTTEHESDYQPYAEEWADIQKETAAKWQGFHEEQLIGQDS